MIYFDSAATTRVLEKSAQVAAECMVKNFANPSSRHLFGFNAERAVAEARKTVAGALRVKSEEIYFTSGGTASDNLAITGTLPKKKCRIITSAYEHPAVSECLKQYENTHEIVYLKPENGIITPEILKNALTDDTFLVSIMHVNNETGAINPIAELASLTKRYSGALFHTDAVQGFLKEPLDLAKVDMASFSGHKVHAPKGVGVLYVKKGVKIKPLVYGGGQEGGLFCGTENVPAICALAASVSELCDMTEQHRAHVSALKEKILSKCLDLGCKVVSPANSTPYILSVAFPGYMSENILNYLSEREICVSTGSACSSKKASATYKAIGLENLAKSTLRLSFSFENTAEEADIFCENLEAALAAIAKVK